MGRQPYTNMFASDLGSLDPSYPVNTLEGNVLKKYGGTVLGIVRVQHLADLNPRRPDRTSSRSRARRWVVWH